MNRKLVGVFTAVVAALLLVGVAWAGSDAARDDAGSSSTQVSPTSVVSLPDSQGEDGTTSVEDRLDSSGRDDGGSTVTTIDDNDGSTPTTIDDDGDDDRTGTTVDDNGGSTPTTIDDDTGTTVDDHGGDRDDSGDDSESGSDDSGSDDHGGDRDDN